MVRRRVGLVLRVSSALGAAFVALGAASMAGAAGPRPVLDVRDFGATGSGEVVDTPAIDSAIAAAAAGERGGLVRFPRGTYLATTIHLRSRVALRLDEGATIVAAATGFDPPEENPFSAYQDFGHSHFRNSLIVGEGVEDVAIVGRGAIDGSALRDDNAPPSGQGDKTLALRSCRRVRVQGVAFVHPGHVAIAMNGCREVVIDRVRIRAQEDRDGIDVVNSSAVAIERSDVAANDDAIAFKSDYALGRTFVSRDDRVVDTVVDSAANNALKIGTETCGDFRRILFRDVKITGAGAAGIGITSLDGGTVEAVTAERIAMVRVATPLFVQMGSRGRCPAGPPPGRIRGLVLRDVVGRGLVGPDGGLENTPAIVGMIGHPVEDVTLERVDFVVPGGHPSADVRADPREPKAAYAPNALGERPAYGLWIRHVRGLALTSSSFGFSRDDGRPAVIVDDAESVSIDGLRAERGRRAPYDVGLVEVGGYSACGGETPGGDPLRIVARSSTPASDATAGGCSLARGAVRRG